MAISKDAITKKKPAQIQPEQPQGEPRTAAETLEEEEADRARHKKNEATRRTKDKREGLAQIACWVDEETYQDIQRLASYRAGRDRKTTLQSTINDALKAYLKACKKELDTWDSVKLPNE